METYWRKCGSCKKDIGFNKAYQVCSVCKGKYAFCSVDCWDQHVPVLNHKNAWAEEERSPAMSTTPILNTNDQPVRRIVNSPSQAQTSSSSTMEAEILIVASKLKQYVKDKYDLNTSADVMDALSRDVRRLTDRAVEKARADGRKTLMGRDF